MKQNRILGSKIFGFLLICSFSAIFAACGTSNSADDAGAAGAATTKSCPASSNMNNCSLEAASHDDSNGTCITGYTGTCGYTCDNGEWAEDSNLCLAPCLANSNMNNCSLAQANHGDSDGTCITGYAGTCGYTCDNGEWAEDSNSCALGQICPATSNMDGCSLSESNHGESDGECASGYIGSSSCSFNCNDGTWELVSNSCVLGQICPATSNMDGCSLSESNHGESDGECATGYTGSSSCSFNCNDGMWEEDSNSCFAQCPADFNIGTCSSSSNPANHGDRGVTGSCATDYTGTCSLNCNDGMWEEDSNSCFAPCLANSNMDGCSLAQANHGDSDVAGTCATGYTTGTCSYICNNGVWKQPTEVCFAQCPADSDIHTCSSSSDPANHGASGVAGSCATGYTGTCSLNCDDGMWTSNENMCDADTDSDSDGIADMNDLCASTSFTSSPSNDIDRDGCEDAVEDVDDDGNGLIEITTAAMLDDMRYNPAGNSYATSTGDTGDNSGCGGQSGITECNGYELDNDITLTGTWDVITGDFTGTFDGKGFSISGLIISSGNKNVGFFANVSGLIRNIHLTGSTTVTSTSGTTNSTAGSLVGVLNSGGRVFSSSSTLSITGNDSVGGLVGRNNGGTIRNSYATGNANGGAGHGDRPGGLVGYNNGGTIQNSYATGNANGGSGQNDYVGGLVGRNTGGTIRNSYATGNANGGAGGNDSVGGLVGQNTGGGSVPANNYRNSQATIEGEESTTTLGTARTMTELQSGTGTEYTNWSTNDWDFGTNTQYPALRSYETDSSQGDLLCDQLSPRAQCLF